jgi:hypothetical protein
MQIGKQDTIRDPKKPTNEEISRETNNKVTANNIMIVDSDTSLDHAPFFVISTVM